MYIPYSDTCEALKFLLNCSVKIFKCSIIFVSQIEMEIMIKVPKKKLFVFKHQKSGKSGLQSYQETYVLDKKDTVVCERHWLLDTFQPKIMGKKDLVISYLCLRV